MSDSLDRWISANIRNYIEDHFYAVINEKARLSLLIDDPEFMAAPLQHIGLFADHGVVHVRNVAHQVLNVLDICHGVLIPRRDLRRFTFMQGYGVLLAYLHDIGMVDFSAFGRAMHPEFAAQAVFDPGQDGLIESIWAENSGGLGWHLLSLASHGLIGQDLKLVLRELLSLSIGHSKSKVPMAVLNDPGALRSMMIDTVITDLRFLFADQQRRKQSPPTQISNGSTGAESKNPQIARIADLFPDRAYVWLTDDRPELQELVEDVVDTIRALRTADALRQRGAVLETSGHYQVFVDQFRGNSIYALRLGKERFYLLEMSDPISAGEANIASSELDRTGDLRISFHRGFFRDPGAQEHAAYCAALVILDIQRDVIESFQWIVPAPGVKQAEEMLILLEETEDDVFFAQMVNAELARLNPGVARSVRLTPSLNNVHQQERARYLAAAPLSWEPRLRGELIMRMGRTGYPANRVDQERAFENVRLIKLQAGDVLIEGGTPAYFVYLPLERGLIIMPLGGYQAFAAEPWLMLGGTGVVRGSERSATIVAECEVQVLMIPKSTYLTYWHHTLSLDEFRTAIAEARIESSVASSVLSHLEKRVLLQSVPLLKTLDEQTMAELVSNAQEVHVAMGETVIVKGSVGSSLFVVASGSLRVYDDDLHLSNLGAGDVFGELAVIAPELRTASVMATEDSRLLQLHQADLIRLIDNHREVAYRIIEVLADYVRNRTADAKEWRKRLDELTGRPAP
jgi:hypothetical protein